MFKAKQNAAFPKMEEKTLSFWEDQKIFEKSLEQTASGKLFSFYDGPPFATGLPHYGHLLAAILKDVVPRYKTMHGFYVPRRFGWDCHGLPVENEIEKCKATTGAEYVKQFGMRGFNTECRSIVLRYTKEWKKTVKRFGRWVDFDNTYRTMDLTFMESVWWVFKQLFEKGLVYEGFKVMPFSTRMGTPLSNFEANLNYKDVDDPSLTVSLPVVGEPNTFLLAWTTTPWTLISNLALAVGGDLDYVKINDAKTGHFYIMAEALVKNYFKEGFAIVSKFKGRTIEGLRYLPLFDYFAGRAKEGAFRVIVDDFVSVEDGTGIVHTAPSFGEVDFYACQKAGIEPVCPVDKQGCFTAEAGEYEGMPVKDADKKIIAALKAKGRVFKQATIRHRYPFCWRTDTPLIYRSINTWFVAVEKIKEQLIAANTKIHWVPDHIKEGRFGKWLENARDWSISRNRFWGTPIPLWRSQDGDLLVIGSIAELEKLSGAKITDLHREHIDRITIEHQGKTYSRVEEVFDCWFESGSMPYAQNHYPFENKAQTEKAFPADFIAEGLDQTRGWFYTLNVISTALFNQPAFKNVIVNGILLAEDGTKMSKRLKNYPEPELVINRHGADAVRLYLLGSGAVRAEDLCFSEKGVELSLRQILIPLWNSFYFLSTYANIYKWQPPENYSRPKAPIDRWILSLQNKLILQIEAAMNAYELDRAIEPFAAFIDHLTNWYIRRSRGRFWADEDTQDRKDAFATLYRVLFKLVQIVAPFIPFMTEEIYRELRRERDPLSVHLCPFPKYIEEERDLTLEEEMEYVQKTVAIGRSLRKEQKIKVRQPLSVAHVVSADPRILELLLLQKDLIAEELNVKEIKLERDEAKYVRLNAKPNFRVLGKKLGALLPLAQQAIANLDSVSVKALQKGQSVPLTIKDQHILLQPEDLTIERQVLDGLIAGNDGEITLALDLTMTEELLLEGLAREMINKVNTMRKEMKFKVVDRIHLAIDATDMVKACFAMFGDYIKSETLAIDVQFTAEGGSEIDLNGETVRMLLKKI